ncbi:MAG: DNA-processing protein DprA [Anaerotignum sp.]|nr:DNA-processing protein DprA [Anaerotignum sp.]
MEEYYLMWLSRIDGIGFKKANHLLEHFGSAEAIWYADPKELRTVQGLGEKLMELLITSRDEDQLNDWIIELEEKDIAFYSYWNPFYPTLLKNITDPPLGIYVRGELPDDDIDTVAIIGARKCSRYGATVAYDIAKELAKTNLIIVSGMARGIDSEGHRGILDGGGKTIAVLGCGVDICYPPENKGLMDRILQNGCILSEYPPGTPAMSGHFPARNRIIAGLSRMVVVVEAGKKSGTLITADLALDYGRDVFVVPGNVTSALSKGTNELIKQGCPIITEGNDILIALGIAYKEDEKVKFKIKTAENISAEEKEVFDLIETGEPISAETLCRKLHKDIQDVQYILSLLELSGYITKIPLAVYVRYV